MTPRIYQEGGVILVICLGLVLSSAETYAYEYSFEVHQVSNCPVSEEAWEKASIRLNCTQKHGYHCVPDEYFTSLVEFCYSDGDRLPSEKGHCLELAEDGILNQVPCNTFDSGCPEQFYFSNEIYKYPKCLSINTNFKCFDADVPCILSKNAESTTNNIVHNTSSQSSITLVNRIENHYPDYFGSFVVISTLFVVENIALFGFAFVMYKYYIRRKYPKHDDGYLAESTPLNDIGSTYDALESSSKEDLPDLLKGEDPNFVCLRDICREGKEVEFHSMTNSKSFDKDLLNKTDTMGWTLLHHAAYGGKMMIFQQLMSYKIIDLRATDIIGRTVLHISTAAKKGEENGEIFKAIVEKEKALLEVEDKNGLMPFCYAALAGNKSILEQISMYGFDIRRQTKYGETVAHLACIGNSSDVLQMLSKMDEKGKQESLRTTKDAQRIISTKNKMDWNPVQYAAKTGNKKILQFLDEEKVLVFYSTGDLKYSFHTACENGNLEACKYIAEHSKQSLHAHDKSGRHAGHFASKSGNVEILKYLETQGLKADGLSAQNINILHIACRHGRLDMCKYIAERYPELVTQESKKGWNPALFIGERGGADEERINILTHLVTKHDLFVYHVSRAGKSILFNACANRSYTLCEHLLKTYPGLLTIERSMDPKRGAKDKKINELINKYS
ncbi:alpha-latroinsectotoxin-Lt1a-like [Ostrea edulis]|uniref:alpha-latroinsectotoxin-Lt1a-like n=1 Tax=Ostrea edulis TaxID=37623 RepID=UPI0024AFA6FC|nr:alpha-latroinsectotoxin-Lt1a-like [Ostrea edulis]XP_055999264.1 alpha-latroinsectotoxin-Lt1a-like [Ostrea edulis]